MTSSFESSAREQDPDVERFVALFDAWETAGSALYKAETSEEDPEKCQEARSTFRRVLSECADFIKTRAKTKGAQTFNGALYMAIPKEDRDSVNNFRQEVMNEILEEMMEKK